MKSIKYLFIIATLIFTGTVACDIIEDPYTTDSEGPVVDSNSPNILLEEFTGHTCIYCPGGSKIAKALEQQYYGKIFVVTIHCGNMARPENGDKYNYDFRTLEGTELDVFYKINTDGLPRGMINRFPYNNKTTISASNWKNAVTNFWKSNKIRQVDIDLTAQYNNSTKIISGNLKLNYLISQNLQNKLSVWIVEDDIINWQRSIDPPYDIPDYQHNDVLRYSFNGTWGENISSSNIPVGFVFEKNYSLQIEDRDWNPNNLRFIAFVYDDNGVKQVIDAKVLIDNTEE